MCYSSPFVRFLIMYLVYKSSCIHVVLAINRSLFPCLLVLVLRFFVLDGVVHYSV